MVIRSRTCARGEVRLRLRRVQRQVGRGLQIARASARARPASCVRDRGGTASPEWLAAASASRSPERSRPGPQHGRGLHRLVGGAGEDRRGRVAEGQLHAAVRGQHDQASRGAGPPRSRTGRPRPERGERARGGQRGGRRGYPRRCGGPWAGPAFRAGRLTGPAGGDRSQASRSSTCASPSRYLRAISALQSSAVRCSWLTAAGDLLLVADEPAHRRRAAPRPCGRRGRTARPRRASPRPAGGTPRCAACRA